MGAHPPAQETIRFGLFEVDLGAGGLRREGRKVNLQEQPFQILVLLLERPGEVIAREELQQKLWPKDTFVDFEAGLNTAIRKLREALGDSADNPRFVETLPRRGYRFIAPVDGGGQSTRPALLQPRRFWLLVGAGVVVAGLVAVAVLVGVNKRGRQERLPGRVEPGQIRSLAVLPLENLTGDPAQEYFVDGMHDALITDLVQIGSLRVISRTSVMRYKRTKDPLPKIAEDLNVEAVMEGAVVRSGQRVRITAQLIDARTDRHLWAGKYERELSDVVALQGEVARAIADAIKVELTPQERALLGSVRRVNPDAYDAFLRGVLASGRGSVEGFREAIANFEEATKKQPDFAPAYAAMALCNYDSLFLPLAPKEFMPKAEAAARKALELDETIAEAHFALGAILYRYHWDWSGAEKEYRRAKELPTGLQRPGFYEFLSARGRFEEALAEAQRARELDPLSLQRILNVGKAFRAAGQYDRAMAEYRKVLEKNPRMPRAHFQLGVAYVLKGDLNEGIAALEKAVELSPGNPRFAADLGYAYAVSRRSSEARKVLQDLKARSWQQYVSPYGIALIHVGLREKEPALAWLTKAYEAHAFELAEMASDRRLDPLRSDPPFQDLARRVGPPAAPVPGRSGAQ